MDQLNGRGKLSGECVCLGNFGVSQSINTTTGVPDHTNIRALDLAVNGNVQYTHDIVRELIVPFGRFRFMEHSYAPGCFTVRSNLVL